MKRRFEIDDWRFWLEKSPLGFYNLTIEHKTHGDVREYIFTKPLEAYEAILEYAERF